MYENPVSNEAIRFPKTEEYLKSEFVELSNNYRKGGHTASCTLVAFDVAGIVLEEGGHPSILSIVGQKVDSINTKTIVPKCFEGRITWGAHQVCENEGIVYDPMVGKPLPLETYLQTVFTEPVEAEVRFSTEQIKESNLRMESLK
ncbi:MAG: hypothetical protein KBD16_02160 [Candidatus Pacebacteria bacterium]|nr:hypothetical protein [Candidatus Paceibacterota bacterium]